jgi:hypothetical protein
MPDDDSEWIEEHNGLWVRGSEPLTVGRLMATLSQVVTNERSLSGPLGGFLVAARTAPTANIPVEVEFYDGAASRTLHPMHIDVRADQGRPSTVVITVA